MTLTPIIDLHLRQKLKTIFSKLINSVKLPEWFIKNDLLLSKILKYPKNW